MEVQETHNHTEGLQHCEFWWVGAKARLWTGLWTGMSFWPGLDRVIEARNILQ